MSLSQPPPTAPAVRTRPDVGWTELVTGAVAYLVLAFAFGMVVHVVTVGSPGIVLMLAAGTLATVAATAVALGVRVRSLAPLRLRGPGTRWLLIGLAAGVGVCLVNRLVVVLWMLVTGDTSNPQQSLTDGAAAGGWTLVGVVVLGGLAIPLGEELLFRGVIYSALRRYGVIIAILASSAIFGIAHGVNVVLVAAFLLGAVNAWMVERSGSIWPAVMAHATNNTILFGLAAVLG